MALVKYYRDQLGRFAKFTPGELRRPLIFDTINRKVISEGLLKIRKAIFNFTGVRYMQHGQFVRYPTKGEFRIQYDMAHIFIDGVKVANLMSNTTISKRDFNWVIANLKGTKTKYGKKRYKKIQTKKQLLEMLAILYPDSRGVQDDIQDIQEDEAKDIQYHAGMLPAYLPSNSILYRRKQHNNYMLNFWVLDTEDDSDGNIKMVNFFDGVNHFSFVNDDSLQLKYDTWNFIEDNFSRDGANIFCVNLHYDLNNVYGEVWKEWENIFSGSILLHTKLNSQIEDDKHRSKVNFYESMGQIPMGVKDMGDSIGIKKLDPGGSRINLKYCRRDCEITYKSLKKIFDFDRENKIEFAMSMPGKSLKYFRTHCLTTSIKQRQFTEFRPAYRGGRVEIFKYGKQKDINVYDINSLYPYVMKNYSYPNPRDAQKTDQISNFGIYYVKLKIKDDTYIPYLGKVVNKKYVFPVGEFFGLYTGFELIKAHDYGQIENIELIEGFKFGNVGSVFTDFVDKFYSLRLQNSGSELLNKYTKRIMNSLYGKWAQGNKSLKYDPQENIISECYDKFPKHSNFIWSIFITAYARDELFNYLNTYNKNVVYCDTDSIHLNNSIEITTGKDLGNMKHEGFFKSGNYIQPKVYSLEDGKQPDKFVAKGVKSESKKEYIKTGKATFKRPVKIREFLQNQKLKQNNSLIVDLKLNKWITITKIIKTKYQKRIIINDKGLTKPIKLYLKLDK